jgi:hypothetical protein
VVNGKYSSALVSNTKFKKFDGTSNARREMTCHRCSKPGHIARYCRSKPNFGQDDTRKSASLGGESANIVGQNGGSSSENKICLVGVAKDDAQNMEWLIDPGASSHMSACRESMCDYKPFTPFDISIGDKTKLQVIGSGQVKLQLSVQGQQKNCVIKNVLHVPMLGYNLLSVSAMKVYGMKTQFASGKCTIKDKNSSFAAQGTRKG